ncbi:Kelch repeat-containing protein [Reichenbachiella sp.]|uniref:Kelch repeat-containing protein n=1 Tax=Reichenbachiella sp. TaxID=2184521 RepID=UPI003BAEC040
MKQLRLTLSILFCCAFLAGCNEDGATIPVEITTADFTATLEEDPVKGQSLGKVAGSANPGEVVFAIKSQEPADAMIIDGSTGELKVNDATAFDFETRKEVIGIVTVSSGDVSEEAKVTITITDVPVVVSTEGFSVSINENPEAGQSLGNVSGTASEGSISFKISEQDVVDAISIDATTGELKINDPLTFDYETRIKFLATVVVTGGNDMTQAQVTITINNLTEIITQDFSASLAENPENDYHIGLVTGSVDTGNLAYSIFSQTPADALAINAETGELTVNDNSLFDFETNPRITAVVKASAGDVSEELAVSLTLTDVVETVSWTEKIVSGPTFTGVDLAQVVSFKSKIFVIGGVESGNKYSNKVWSTADGINWGEASIAAFSARYYHEVIEFNDKLWLIGGYDGEGKNDVWSSTDGITWTLVTNSAPLAGRTGHKAAVFNNKMWVVAGRAPGLNSKNDVYSSTDGITWTQETTNAAFDARLDHTLTAFNNKLWVIGGFDSDNVRLDDVWSSPDGVTWKKETLSNTSFSARGTHQTIVYDDKMWLIGGSAAVLTNDVWTSADGINWNAASVSGSHFEARRAHQAILVNDELWVVGGLNTTVFPFTYFTDVWVLDK